MIRTSMRHILRSSSSLLSSSSLCAIRTTTTTTTTIPITHRTMMNTSCSSNSITSGNSSSNNNTIRSIQQLNPADVQVHGISFSSLQYQTPNTICNDDTDDESEHHNVLAYCLSFSNDESEFSKQYIPLLNTIMEQQLYHVTQKQQQQLEQHDNDHSRRQNRQLIYDTFLKTHHHHDTSLSIGSDSRNDHHHHHHPKKKNIPIDTEPLPRTLMDAIRPSKVRSIIITETKPPFRIVNVNTAWEQLCGYTYIEAKGKTIGSLLHGPSTDTYCTTLLIAKLLDGTSDDIGATIINYKKNKQPFYNRIRMGPLYDDHGTISHYVGVLQEI